MRYDASTNMTSKDRIIRIIAKETGETMKSVRKVLDCYGLFILDEIRNGRKIRLAPGVCLDYYLVPEHMGYNFVTKEKSLFLPCYRVKINLSGKGIDAIRCYNNHVRNAEI